MTTLLASCRASRPRPSRGFSLLEILLVLGIAAALIIAAFVIYPKVKTSQQVLTEQNNIATIAANLRSMYGSKSNYSDLGDVSSITGLIFPSTMLNTSNYSITNTWGGGVSINSGNSIYQNGFQIDYTGVPSEACVKLASATAPSFAVIYVNSAMVKSATNHVALDVGALATACSSVTNSITFFDR